MKAALLGKALEKIRGPSIWGVEERQAIALIIDYLMLQEAENAALQPPATETAGSEQTEQESQTSTVKHWGVVEESILQLIRQYLPRHLTYTSDGDAGKVSASLIPETGCNCEWCVSIAALGVERITLIFRSQESLRFVATLVTGLQG